MAETVGENELEVLALGEPGREGLRRVERPYSSTTGLMTPSA